MLLTIDVGNTNITLGVFDKDRLLFESRMATDHAKTADQYAIELQQILLLNGVNPADVHGGALGSVVPKLEEVLPKAVARITGKMPLVVGPGIKTGLNIRIDNPAQLGADLLIGAVAAQAKYGAPCVVWDLGTATTVSVLDESGAFCGGAIMPGIQTSYNSLSSTASLLPQVRLTAPKKVIGPNTIDCMRSGAVFGNAALMDGMNRRIWDELGYETPVIATGGLSREIVPQCHTAITYDSTLLLDGLRILYEKNQ
ncbi:MAG: type III pantothenate kinase [Clostridia bacterium]|nr:type III pantothenate kinase [Clostridia bacterium]